jgi:hypothetical protein
MENKQRKLYVIFYNKGLRNTSGSEAIKERDIFYVSIGSHFLLSKLY